MNAAETATLLAALDAAQAQGLRVAIATVVGVQGSAYRREGTRMLVLENGAQVCMLSGGCLESEVVEAALDVIESGQSRVVHYDLSEDATWGLGLGCGGSVDVRIERLEDTPVMRTWLAALREGRAAALAVPLTGEGTLFVSETDGTGGLPDHLQDFALKAARQRLAARDPRAATVTAPDGTPIFIDVNAPAPELLIYGAGHDAQPLAAQALALGYRVQVADRRGAYLTPGRFPGAALLPLDKDELPITLPERGAAIIMNHHLDRDAESLRHALTCGAGFVGVLGPRSRYKGLLEALAEDDFVPTPAQLERVRSPVGLSLGAEAPEEVALSILAELMAWRRGARGGPLNGHAGPIHQTYAARREGGV